MIKNILLLVFSFLPSLALSTSLDINGHDEVFRITLAKYVGKKSVGDLGFLSTRYRNANQNETGLHAGLNFVFDKFRFGGRVFYISPGTADALALGLGGQLRVFLSRKVVLGGHFYYAPQATSFMDAEGYSDLGVRLSFKLARKAYFYVGYRTIKVKIFSTNNTVELDDDIHIGLKLYF